MYRIWWKFATISWALWEIISTSSILVDNTYNAFAILFHLFAVNIKSDGILSKLSSIHSSSVLKKNVQIDSFVDIGENCIVHENVIIHSNCKIGTNAIIGSNTIIYKKSNLQDWRKGSDCILKSSAVIGGSGFGFDRK